MTLYLITYDLDNTQFLVNANDGRDAIELAIEQNLSEKFLGNYDDESDAINIKKITNYTIEFIGDFESLCEIIKRNDWIGCTPNVMIFRD